MKKAYILIAILFSFLLSPLIHAQVMSGHGNVTTISNKISVKTFSGCAGTEVIVTIDVDNDEDFVALQCDLKYPEYLTPNPSSIVLTTRKVDHMLQTSLLGNNTIRLIAFSLSQQLFTGKTGAVIQIPFTISSSAVKGSYPLTISNGIIGNRASQNIVTGISNGTLTITDCLSVGINDESLTHKVEVFPNPTTDVFYVTLHKPFNNDFVVEVCNDIGQILQTISKNKAENKFSVELTNYPSGVYFLKLSDKENRLTQKIIKK